jgi:hypothetical protein
MVSMRVLGGFKTPRLPLLSKCLPPKQVSVSWTCVQHRVARRCNYLRLARMLWPLMIIANRLKRVEENLKRVDLKAQLVTSDVFEVSADEHGLFDAVLLDAPCSATGTMRRHPDLPHAKDGSDFGALIDLQARMLAHAMGLVKPGGRLVFCTCSLLPDEGEVHIDEADLTGWSVDPCGAVC